MPLLKAEAVRIGAKVLVLFCILFKRIWRLKTDLSGERRARLAPRPLGSGQASTLGGGGRGVWIKCELIGEV